MAEIKAYIWNEGSEPGELAIDSEPLRSDYDYVRNGLCHALEGEPKFEFGKLTIERGGNEFELLFRAFDDEHRGRQIVAGTDAEDLEKSYALRCRDCAQKVFSPQELYALKPVRAVSGSMLHHFIAVHLQGELDNYDLDWDKLQAEQPPRLEVRYLADACPDGRRTWTLGTAWFDGKPFMVANSSGRDGDEYYNRWITDAGRFRSMVEYLSTFVPHPAATDIVGPDKVIPGMTEFYSATLHDHYDVAQQAGK